MTPALLFALVDLRLVARRNAARWSRRFWHDREAMEFADMKRVTEATASLGWWRSLWPLGGGA